MMSDEKAKYKKKLLKDKCHQNDDVDHDPDIEESELLTKFINECRLALLSFRRNELSIELVTQLSIHLAMILLSQTKYPVESGLQEIFKSNDKAEEKSNTALTFLVLGALEGHWRHPDSPALSLSSKMRQLQQRILW